MVMHHCLSCGKDERMMKIVLKLFKNGRPALQGNCKVCGARMTRFLPKFPPLEQGVVHDTD